MQRNGLGSGQDSGTKKERTLERAGKAHCPALVCLREQRLRTCLGCLTVDCMGPGTLFPVHHCICFTWLSLDTGSAGKHWIPGKQSVITHSFQCFLGILSVYLSSVIWLRQASLSTLMCGFQNGICFGPWIKQQALKCVPPLAPQPS